MQKFAAMSLAAVLTTVGTTQAHEIVYNFMMSGPAEAPPNSSPGIGSGTITIDLDLVTMRVQASFSGLTGNVTAAHIHGPTTNPFAGTAGVMTPLPSFPGFPHGATFGTYDQTFDLTLASSYNPAFITASGGTISLALNRMLLAFEQGRAYLNIHTTTYGGGEIRGFLPAPGAAAALGLGALVAARRRR